MTLLRYFCCLLYLVPFALQAQVYENTEYGFSVRYAATVWKPLPAATTSSIWKLVKPTNSVWKAIASRQTKPEAEVSVFITPVPASEKELTVEQLRAGNLITIQRQLSLYDYQLTSTKSWYRGSYEGIIFDYFFKLPFNPRTHAVMLLLRRGDNYYRVTYSAKEEADETFRASGIAIVTSLAFPEAVESTEPVTIEVPVGPGIIFGGGIPLSNGLAGKLYALPERTEKLPDFDGLQPFGEVYTKEINIAAREWTAGFPGMPGTAPRVEWFGIEYKGYITPILSASTLYDFRLVSDDGARLFIDGKLVLDNDGIHSASSASGQVTLTASRHSFKLQYFQGPRYTIALQLFVKSRYREEAIFPGELFTLSPLLPPPPSPQALWQGRILDDSTHQPLSQAHLQPAPPAPAVAVTEIATFAWRAAPGRSYAYEVRQPGYYVVHDTWQATAAGRQQDILLKKIRIGSTIRLDNVQFKQTKSELLPGTTTALQNLLKLLTEHPTMTIELAGHTDNVGPAEKNVQLSEARVAAVKAYLVQHGIAAPRIAGRGYGGSRPQASNDKEETRRLNRRVEFTITSL